MDLKFLNYHGDDRPHIIGARALSYNINRSHRNSVLKWLFESLELLKVEDRVFFATVILADRYCSRLRCKTKLEGSELQLIILSCLCCCLKTVESSLDLSVKAFLEHVSGGHVDSKDIFHTESEILEALNFDVFAPSLSVFLESFFLFLSNSMNVAGPLEQSSEKAQISPDLRKQYFLSLFLLFLVVFEPDVLYSASLSEIVSGCILVSASTLDSENFNSTVRILLNFEWMQASSDMSSTMNLISKLWERVSQDKSEVSLSIKALFDCEAKFFVSRMIPRQNAPSSGG
jgi:hypothetical protein